MSSNVYVTTPIPQYTVDFLGRDGNLLSTQIVNYGDSVTPPIAPDIIGMNFTGWDSEAYTYVESDLVINSIYEEILFNVYYLDWNGDTILFSQVPYGTTPTPPDNPSRQGYTFTGWSISPVNIVTSHTIIAQYSANTYVVRFINWDDSVLSSVNVGYGESVTPPQEPTRLGYTFTGWDRIYSNISSDIDITATFTINMFSVRFIDWDGSLIYSEIVPYGSSPTLPQNPVRFRYNFSGWSSVPTNITSDIDIVANYTNSNYKIIYLDHIGNTIRVDTILVGDIPTQPPEVPYREGYDFIRWDTTSVIGTPDIIVTPTYKKKILSSISGLRRPTIIFNTNATKSFTKSPDGYMGDNCDVSDKFNMGVNSLSHDNMKSVNYNLNLIDIIVELDDVSGLNTDIENNVPFRYSGDFNRYNYNFKKCDYDPYPFPGNDRNVSDNIDDIDDVPGLNPEAIALSMVGEGGEFICYEGDEDVLLSLSLNSGEIVS